MIFKGDEALKKMSKVLRQIMESDEVVICYLDNSVSQILLTDRRAAICQGAGLFQGKKIFEEKLENIVSLTSTPVFLGAIFKINPNYRVYVQPNAPLGQRPDNNLIIGIQDRKDVEIIINCFHQQKKLLESKPVKADPFETIKNLKELLDIGGITQEEFEAKKKELLDRI
jgi:hypothetical protein